MVFFSVLTYILGGTLGSLVSFSWFVDLSFLGTKQQYDMMQCYQPYQKISDNRPEKGAIQWPQEILNIFSPKSCASKYAYLKSILNALKACDRLNPV